jgi:hypothetical protein
MHDIQASYLASNSLRGRSTRQYYLAGRSMAQERHRRSSVTMISPRCGTIPMESCRACSVYSQLHIVVELGPAVFLMRSSTQRLLAYPISLGELARQVEQCLHILFCTTSASCVEALTMTLTRRSYFTRQLCPCCQSATRVGRFH